jgi:hypothetical protein
VAFKQTNFRPYRLATPGDLPDLQLSPPADPPEADSAALLAQFTLHTAPYDGVRLNIELADVDPDPLDPDPPLPGYKLDVFFLNVSTGKWSEDKAKAITVNAVGSQTFKVETSGQPVYFRISQLTGVTPVLTIEQGLYIDSKV